MRFASYPACLRKRTPGPGDGTLGGVPRAAVLAAVLAAGVPAFLAAFGAASCRRSGPPAGAPVGDLEGRVTDLSDHPLANATLEVGTDPPDGRVPLGRARTTSSGAFRLERIPAGRYRITVRHSTHAPIEAAVEVRPGAAATRSTLRLPPLAALAGRIEDAHGTPVPLAHVVAVAVGGDATPSLFHETEADAQGRFRLGDLAPGTFRVLIEAPGLGSATAGPLKAPDLAVVVVLPGESRSITGTVTHTGHPVPGARVHLAGETLSRTRTTESDLGGRFAFTGIGPGTYATRAELGPLVSPVASDIAVAATSSLREVALVLGESVTFHGRVIDEKGQGVPHASVRIDLLPPFGLWPAAETDAAGRWTSAAVGPGQYQLRARMPGFTARRTALVSVIRPGDADPLPPAALTLEVVRSGRIVGRLVGSDGKPVANARVHDRAAEVEELGVIGTALPAASEAAALPPAALPTSEGKRVARQASSDGTGRFQLDDVPPGRLQLEVLHPASVPFRGPPVVLAPGQTLDAGTLRLSLAARISGRVVDERGQPVAGARVTAEARGTRSADSLYALTDGEGAFTLPVAPGTVKLTASAVGRTDVETVVEATVERPGQAGGPAPGSGGSRTPVILAFRGPPDPRVTATRPLRGLVRDGAARPIAGARVLAFPRSPVEPGGSRATDERPLATTRTDAGGHFQLERLPDAPLWLETRHESYPPHREAIGAASASPPSTEIAIDVPLPGAVWGEVHERATGGPVRRFALEARGPDGGAARFPLAGRRAEPREDPFRFRLGPLAPGAWTIRASAPGFAPVERQVQVPSSGMLGEPSVRDIRIELEPTS